MAELLAFPNDTTREFIEGEVRRVLADDTATCDTINQIASLILSHPDTATQSSIYKLANHFLKLYANSPSNTRDNFPAITNLLEMVSSNPHPTFRDMRRTAAAALQAATVETPTSIHTQEEQYKHNLMDILNEICSRELPKLDGQTEFPETAFFWLYSELPRNEFEKIFFAYCDTYGVNYDNLLQ